MRNSFHLWKTAICTFTIKQLAIDFNDIVLGQQFESSSNTGLEGTAHETHALDGSFSTAKVDPVIVSE